MSRRPRTANSVSLFPFLAVLVCAMGALILLLIVTTRRIRSDAIQNAQTVAPKSKPVPKPKMVTVPPKKKPIAKAVVTIRPDRPLLPRTIETPDERWHSQTAMNREDPNPALRRTLSRLKAERDQRTQLSDEALTRLSASL